MAVVDIFLEIFLEIFFLHLPVSAFSKWNL